MSLRGTSDVPILIACCPKHGLHGERQECFVCGGPVQQVPMVPVGRSRGFQERRRTTAALFAYFRGAEYPMGRVRAFFSAWRMSRTWPR